MVRIFARIVISVLSNALGLVVAGTVLEDMRVGASGFVIAVLIFTGIAIITEPMLRQAAMKSAPVLLGSSALLTVLVSLVITTAVSDNLTIHGATTWILATVIVWVVALAGRLLLPLVIFKKAVGAARSE